MFDVIVKNCRMVSSDGITEADILVKDGKVAAISSDTSDVEASRTIDAGGKFVMPGVVDEHVHIIDMDLKNRYGRFELDSESAAVGGITTIIEMPITFPPTTTLDAFLEKKKQAGQRLKVDFALYGGGVPGNLPEIRKMHDAGAVGFKSMMAASVPGMFDAVSDGELFEIFQEIAACGSVVVVHAENETIIQALQKQIKAAGRKDMAAYEASQPVFQENEAIQRALLLQKEAGCRLIVLHVSNPDGVELIHQAQSEGQDVHCESGPQYLNITTDDAERIGPYMKVAPPVRSAEMNVRLWEQLKNGLIDTLGSDHGGHPVEDKEPGWKDVWKAGNGALGLETSLPMMLTNGVNKGRLSLERLVEVMCEKPAKLFGIYPQKGTLQLGSDADLLILDLDIDTKVDASQFRSLHKYSPFDGMPVTGAPVLTMVRGTVVAEKGEVLVEQGFGQFVTRHDYEASK
ncbi:MULTISPECIES: allantoinase AllB [unclassified Arthrobacter]|uniref:allantoinase AllB n=1 Tax=unclassified Arthrobacter TaxID=235627 RepID=UPI0011B00081|nr:MULTISPECIES: allantoinase AllB [unclassified Arthrobacter]